MTVRQVTATIKVLYRICSWGIERESDSVSKEDCIPSECEVQKGKHSYMYVYTVCMQLHV